MRACISISAMDKPADVIAGLIKLGMTEQAIADHLASVGIQVAQSTIHRIKTGQIEQPKFDVGVALLRLRDELQLSRKTA